MDEEVWVINESDKKIIVGVKEIYFHHTDVAYPKETIMEDIGGIGYKRRILVEIKKVEDANGGDTKDGEGN